MSCLQACLSSAGIGAVLALIGMLVTIHRPPKRQDWRQADREWANQQTWKGQ